MSLKVYFDLMSQPSRALMLFLKLTNINYTPCPVALRKGEHFQDDFRKINPFQKVPVIDDNGFILTESVAILRFLARDRKVADHWYPADLKLQARVDEYLEWQHTNTRLKCAMYFRSKFLEPMMMNKPVDEKRVGMWFSEMKKCLAEVETIWLDGGKKKYIAGDSISIADLLAVCELEQPGMAGYDVFALHPVIGEWRERIRNETQPHYEEVHKFVRQITAKFQGSPKSKM